MTWSQALTKVAVRRLKMMMGTVVQKRIYTSLVRVGEAVFPMFAYCVYWWVGGVVGKVISLSRQKLTEFVGVTIQYNTTTSFIDLQLVELGFKPISLTI